MKKEKKRNKCKKCKTAHGSN